MIPKVSFLVPCYRYAHFLGNCLESILRQTWTDFEVLVMDDCSPDHTSEVVRVFAGDHRVRHVRNDVNLGLPRNFNRGLALARGEYLWGISADDALGSPLALERYVAGLDGQAQTAFVFGPARVLLENGLDGVHAPGWHGDRDRLFTGDELPLMLARRNCVTAPAVLARTECYRRHGGYPLDLPHAADWYMWSHFALDGDALYLAEPLVHYRLHNGNMSASFEVSTDGVRNDVALLLRLAATACRRARPEVAGLAENTAVNLLAGALARNHAGESGPSLDWPEINQLLSEVLADKVGCANLASRVQAALREAHLRLAEGHYAAGRLVPARSHYRQAMKLRPWGIAVPTKWALTALGQTGVRVRAAARMLGARPGN